MLVSERDTQTTAIDKTFLDEPREARRSIHRTTKESQLEMIRLAIRHSTPNLDPTKELDFHASTCHIVDLLMSGTRQFLVTNVPGEPLRLSFFTGRDGIGGPTPVLSVAERLGELFEKKITQQEHGIPAGYKH